MKGGIISRPAKMDFTRKLVKALLVPGPCQESLDENLDVRKHSAEGCTQQAKKVSLVF